MTRSASIRKIPRAVLIGGAVVALVFAANGPVQADTPPKPVSPSVSDPFNGRVSVTVANNGRFAQGAFPDASTGNPVAGSYKTLYGWPSPGTSYTTLRVDGSDHIFGDGGVFNQPPTEVNSSTNQSTWSTSVLLPVKVQQTLALVTNPDTGRADTAAITYKVTNNDILSHSIGVRIMLDTDINDNDGAPFRLPSGPVTTERDLTGAAIPDTFQVFADLADSRHIAAARLRGASATAPDRLVIGSWGGLYGSPWDYTTNPTIPITNDSAYAAYWQPITLAAGATRSVTTYYGLSDVTVDLAPPLALGVTGPTSLAVSGGAYTPNPFTVTATVADVGAGAATGTALTLQLPPGLHTTSTNPVTVGDLSPGGAEGQASWQVYADLKSSSVSRTYSVTASATNTASKTVSRAVALPAVSVGNYVAMGDSYSSGEGTGDYLKGTDVPGDRCHRSLHAYGPLLNDALSLGDLRFVACSGAVTQDFLKSNHTNHTEPAQDTSLNSTTAYVTLTIGGNDVGFRDVLKACVSGYGCKFNRRLVQVVEARIKALEGQGYANSPEKNSRNTVTTVHSIHSLLDDIHTRAPNADIIVAGYPRVFGTDMNNYFKKQNHHSNYVCDVGAAPSFGDPITHQRTVDFNDAIWMNLEQTKLNSALLDGVNAAKAEGVPVNFIDPTDTFGTHAFCGAAANWFNKLSYEGAVGPWMEGALSPWPGSFHPTLEGQLGYEQKIRLTGF